MRIRRLLLILFFCLSPALACQGQPDPNLVAWTHYYAEGFGLDPDLVVAVIWVESSYCQTAVSPVGAVGLGQLMPVTAQELGVDPNDPVQNIWATTKLLRKKYLEFEDWQLALAAYNAGSGAVREHGGIPPYRETQNFVYKVLTVYTELKQQH